MTPIRIGDVIYKSGTLGRLAFNWPYLIIILCLLVLAKIRYLAPKPLMLILGLKLSILIVSIFIFVRLIRFGVFCIRNGIFPFPYSPKGSDCKVVGGTKAYALAVLVYFGEASLFAFGGALMIRSFF